MGMMGGSEACEGAGCRRPGDHLFHPAAMEAFSRLGADTLKLAEDMARPDWVTEVWAERGLEVRAGIGMFKAKSMQVVSVRLTAGHCQCMHSPQSTGRYQPYHHAAGIRRVVPYAAFYPARERT